MPIRAIPTTYFIVAQSNLSFGYVDAFPMHQRVPATTTTACRSAPRDTEICRTSCGLVAKHTDSRTLAPVRHVGSQPQCPGKYHLPSVSARSNRPATKNTPIRKFLTYPVMALYCLPTPAEHELFPRMWHCRLLAHHRPDRVNRRDANACGRILQRAEFRKLLYGLHRFSTWASCHPPLRSFRLSNSLM